MSSDLVDVVRSCTTVLNTNDEHWEERMKALSKLQDVARKHADDPELCSLDVFRLLDEPFKRQVKDLRSAIVREACTTIALWAQTLRDGFRPLAWMLLPTLVEMSASGNKVITSYINEAVHVMLSHSHVKNAVPIIAELLASRNTHVREACYRYMKVILEHYDTSRLEKHYPTIEAVVKAGMEDASGAARLCSRQCFPLLRAHCPKRALALFERLDPRTQKQLEREDLVRPTDLTFTGDGADSLVSSQPGGDDDGELVPESPLKTTRSVSVERGSARRYDLSEPRPQTARATSTAWHDGNAEALYLGQEVVVRGREVNRGVVKFVGHTHFAKGTWVGVQLDTASGRNDGSVDGESYFECEDNYGLFVKPHQVEAVTTGSGRPVAAPAPAARHAWGSSSGPSSPATAVAPSTHAAGGFATGSRSAPSSPSKFAKPGSSFGNAASFESTPEADDGFLEDTPIGTVEASAEFAEEVLAAHRIHMDDLLESLRQEMLANSRFEALPLDKRTPEAIVAYLAQVQEHMQARVELSKHYNTQVAQFQARLALPKKA